MPPPATLATYNGHSIHIAQENALSAAAPYTTRLAIPAVATYQQLRIAAGRRMSTDESHDCETSDTPRYGGEVSVYHSRGGRGRRARILRQGHFR